MFASDLTFKRAHFLYIDISIHSTKNEGLGACMTYPVWK